MTYKALTNGSAAQRAASLYHLSVEVTDNAARQMHHEGLYNDDQRNALKFFLKEVWLVWDRAQQEVGR